jgi:uncharacterized protein DUF6924
VRDLPATNIDYSLVIRTDYTDDEAWAQVRAAIEAPDPVNGFQAYVEFVDDPAFAATSPDHLTAPDVVRNEHSFVFLVDSATLADPEHPVLAVDLWEDPGRTFRVVPEHMWSVQNNLSLSNMDFSEFADSVSPDGVFRGFADDL